MAEILERPTGTDPEVQIARERTKQANIAGWTAGLSAFFALGTLAASPTWAVAAGVAAIALMVTLICCTVLKR